MQTKFLVTGMKCDGCIANANKALNNVHGFEKADYDLQHGTATVYGEVDPQSVCQALHAAGYPAVVNSK